MEMKPEVVVLSAKEVDREGLRKLLSDGQDDAKCYEFKFIESVRDAFPQDWINEINPKSVMIFLWDPSSNKKHTLECFKKVLLAMKARSNFLLFCQTGDRKVSDESKALLKKWLDASGIPEKQFSIIDSGIGVESEKLVLLHKVLELTAVKKAVPAPSAVSPQATVQKAYFEYRNPELNRKHSRQKRADFITANYLPNAQGQFSLEQLMQLYAVYMSLPVRSELSSSIENVLVVALMSEQGKQDYLANAKGERVAKDKDRFSTALRELICQRFSEKHPEKGIFERVIGILIKLQEYITSQEESWSYKIWGGEETVKCIDAFIENTMSLMTRLYPCLLKPDITPADRTYLNMDGNQFPKEVVDIVNNAFLNQNQLGK